MQPLRGFLIPWRLLSQIQNKEKIPNQGNFEYKQKEAYHKFK